MESWWESLASSAQKIADDINEIGDSIVAQVKEAEMQIEAEQRNVMSTSGSGSGKQSSVKSSKSSRSASSSNSSSSESSSTSSRSASGNRSGAEPSCSDNRGNEEDDNSNEEDDAEEYESDPATTAAPSLALSTTLLPWETDNESSSILSTDLMESILALSQHEANFLNPPKNSVLVSQPFSLTPYVSVLMRVLKFDTNLRRLHAKLIPRMTGARGGEEGFWRNYYMRLLYLRAKVGIDSTQDEEELNTLLVEETHYQNTSPDYATDSDHRKHDHSVRKLQRRKTVLTERIRLRKQIAAIPSDDVLFVDAVPAATPVRAAATAASAVGAGTSASSTPVRAAEAGTAAAAAAVKPGAGTGPASSVTHAGINTTPSISGAGDRNKSSSTSSNGSGSGISASRSTNPTARSIQQILLSDQELDAEIEAELNEATPPRATAAAKGSSQQRSAAGTTDSTAASTKVPARKPGAAASAAAEEDDDEDLDLGADDLDLDEEEDDDIEVELDDLDLDVDEDVLSDVEEEEEEATGNKNQGANKKNAGAVGADKGNDAGASSGAQQAGASGLSPAGSANAGASSIGSSLGSGELVPSADEIAGEMRAGKPKI